MEDFLHLMLTINTQDLFESLYFADKDIDERNFIKGKLDPYVQRTSTFKEAREGLDFLLVKAKTINEDTIISKENWPFVWADHKSRLTRRGCHPSILHRLEEKGREFAELGTVASAYLFCLGCDMDRDLQKKDKERCQQEVRAMEREDVLAKALQMEESKPSDMEHRRRLMALAAEKRMKRWSNTT